MPNCSSIRLGKESGRADSERMHNPLGTPNFSTYVERRILAPLPAVISETAELGWERAPLARNDETSVKARTRIAGFDAEIELAHWSGSTTYVGVRPADTRPHRWGARRRKRWFAAAHDAADDLRRQVLDGWEPPAQRPSHDIDAALRSTSSQIPKEMFRHIPFG